MRRCMGAQHPAPIIALFEQRFEETFKRLGEGGRTPALRVQYHYMLDVIKNFIKCERLADHAGHLHCIVSRMLRHFCSCRTPSICKGCMVVLSADKAT